MGTQYPPWFHSHFEKTTLKFNYLTIFHCQLIVHKSFKNEDFIFFKFCTKHFYWPFILKCIIKKLEACINNKIPMASGTFSLFVPMVLFIKWNKKKLKFDKNGHCNDAKLHCLLLLTFFIYVLILLLTYSILMKHFIKNGHE